MLRLIEAARTRAVAAVNTTLIDLDWSVGEHISRKVSQDGWGKGIVEALSEAIQHRYPGMAGYSARNLWRMGQFFETYQHQPKLAPLLRELSWSHNLLILSRCKREEEREFYLRLASRERWSYRELQRQLSGGLFERTVLSPAKLSPVVTELYPDATTVFKDSYLLEFYLESLDRDVKKPHEQPAIGVLLCATKDHEVVEYALSRTMSPALVAEYQTKLPDKKLLQAKLHEFYQLAEAQAESQESFNRLSP